MAQPTTTPAPRLPHPWERLPAESSPAWAAFVEYRNAGGDRSTRAVAKKLGKSSTLLERWSVTHKWVSRAREYDVRQDKVAVAAIESEIRSMSRRHVQIAQSIQAKAIERLRDTHSSELTAAEALKFLDIAVRIERMAMGAPAEVNQLSDSQEMDRLHKAIAAEIEDPERRRSFALRLVRGSEENPA